MALPPTLPGGYQLWYYYLFLAGGIAVATIFLILVTTHLYGIIKTRHRFCIPLLIGGIFEVIGYAFRVVAHHNTNSTTPYAIQSVLILLAPILFAASVYMYLGRTIIGAHGEYLSMIKPRFLTKIFVTGDVFCFMIQAGGGGMLVTANDSSNVELGEHMILGGLILQVIIFVFFVMVAIRFHVRMAATHHHNTLFQWRKSLITTYALSFLIMLRNVVRAVEYGMGSNGYILRHEWSTFVFDGAPMMAVLLISLTWYKIGVRCKSQQTEIDVESYQMMTPSKCARQQR
ncbi:hypothetical protein LTR10_022414 [Elasticomyces elasticus]|uniref:RTA1 domain protein n=1 Tax=Exophiala sideris TaxID=1016849 RepID=A0ABR0JMN6_9EURO|nr:hypothetical protein LTR10_022414 [Elasticomyces elasticus]KAK5037740.1 hypothetical protein LTS07_001207 [Exophiala sideris]KAK5043722.1 hypothetical protein LTR13_000076 [Exophiala sideris]KAK5067221.1 hypothetical protein LTR69_001208 [Exophiala sideris]KAK5182554.1 hypothetical protein LTR44_004945 [Eurotiomycetes sp. CCFEE 6388]